MQKKKRLLWPLMGLTSIFAVSCKESFKNEPLTDTLLIYTQKNAAKGENLIGVKETGTGKVVINASDYQKITADEDFIICIKEVENFKQIWVYRFNGECIGWFDTFNHFSVPGNYYFGTNYNRSMYYFPKTKVLLRTYHSYSALNYVFIEEEGIWKIFSYDGDLVQTLPPKAKLLHNLSENKETFYVLSEEKEKVTLLNIENKETKTYSKEEWSKKSSELKSTEELSGLTLFEVHNF